MNDIRFMVKDHTHVWVFSLLVFFSLVINPSSYVSAYTSPGSPTGFVNDFAAVLSPETVTALDQELTQFRTDTTSEISVVTVKTIGDDYIENYAEKLFKEWGVGTEKNDNGVLLLLSIDDRKLRIEVGYGLEGALPDSVADSIIRNEIVPRLKVGSYDDAVRSGASAIESATRGEYTADPVSSDTSSAEDMVIPFFFFGIIALQWLAAILGRSKSWWLGGVLGLAGSGGITVFDPFGFSTLTYAFIIVGATVFGLFFDYVVSNTFQHAQRHGLQSPWWTGGNSGFGGSSSGGFGGFGGGSSGGGGASGSW